MFRWRKFYKNVGLTINFLLMSLYYILLNVHGVISVVNWKIKILFIVN